MGIWNFLTRKKKKPNNTVNNTPLPPPTPNQAALLQKLAQEIVALYDTRKQRSAHFARTIMNKNAGNVFVPYETAAIQYLSNVLEELKKDPNPFFFNEAYATFLHTKNDFVQGNLNVFKKRKNSIPLINGVLRRMRLYAAALQNTNNNMRRPPRPTRPSFNSVANFSNDESNGSSLPSLESLRRNTAELRALNNLQRARRHVYTRRLKGHVKPNQGTPPPEEV
jgi:hypothetical protein